MAESESLKDRKLHGASGVVEALDIDSDLGYPLVRPGGIVATKIGHAINSRASGFSRN